jgi:hypothetical protein
MTPHRRKPRRTAGLVLALLPAFISLGCRSHKKAPAQKDTPNEPSPNASILPAPLASGAELVTKAHAAALDGGRVGIPADSAGRLILPDAGPPPPRAFRGDQALPRDTLTQRDGIGATLQAEWKWFETPAPAAVPELDKDGEKRARDKTALTVTIDLALAGRMRFAFDSVTFPLPVHSELRARRDHYGNVLVWPNGQAYRVLEPGALRAMFAERRADVVPLVAGKLKHRGKGKLLGLDTEKLQLTSPTGKLLLEQARVPGTGSGGELLCRLLVELVAIQPASSACRPETVPLSADFTWPDGGRLGFAVSSLTRRQDLPIGGIFVPPVGALFKPGELPPQSSGVLLTKSDLTALRTGAAKSPHPEKGAPGEGLMAVNHTDTLRYVLLDGIPIAWVRPRSQQYVIGPPAGHYSVGWRDFLGTEIEPPRSIDLPARVELGGQPDAGTGRK